MNLDQFLIIVHFIGLALGFSSGFGNMVMAGLIAKAAPPEKAVLSRFPPAMGRLGVVGLVLLWASGIAVAMTRYGGFAAMPRPFTYKLVAVVLLTVTVAYIHVLQPRAQNGDAAAMARIQTLGRLSGPLSLVAVIFAVLTFS